MELPSGYTRTARRKQPRTGNHAATARRATLCVARREGSIEEEKNRGTSRKGNKRGAHHESNKDRENEKKPTRRKETIRYRIDGEGKRGWATCDPATPNVARKGILGAVENRRPRKPPEKRARSPETLQNEERSTQLPRPR